MRFQGASYRKKLATWLQLFLVAGLFLYLYSPLLDHWLGNIHYGRPHNHLHLNPDLTAGLTGQSEHDMEGPAGHEEGVFCFLDINVLLSILPTIDVTPAWLFTFAQNVSLIHHFDAVYFSTGSVYLPLFDPPPRI